jgi:beta-glucosidase
MVHSNETHTEALLRKMTLKEKVALLLGEDPWRAVSNARLGIPSVTMTEGPRWSALNG